MNPTRVFILYHALCETPFVLLARSLGLIGPDWCRNSRNIIHFNRFYRIYTVLSSILTLIIPPLRKSLHPPSPNSHNLHLPLFPPPLYNLNPYIYRPLLLPSFNNIT